MNLDQLLSDLVDCPCGKEHTLHIKTVEIGEAITDNAGRLLLDAGYPSRILVVADETTLKASNRLLEILRGSGFLIKEKIFKNLTNAYAEDVSLVQSLCGDVDGILAVGSGSVSDVCRVAAYKEDKAFAIFATAASMDGFASDSAPIIDNGFKLTWSAKQPDIIIADTRILAAAPVELKAAGFGDMAAKYTALADWRIANLLTGEYYCPRIAELVTKGLEKVMSMADRVTKNDPETCESIMEGLVMSGLAMTLAGCSRPASGAEHVLSHFWECKKLQAGLWTEFHGKKTGVASVLITELYRKLAHYQTVEPHADMTDWEAVSIAYGGALADEMIKMNSPTITDEIEPYVIRKNWPEIRQIILHTLPETETLRSLLKRAGAATDPKEVNVDDELRELGLKYHPYMRHRVLLTRLIPMLNFKPEQA